MTDIHLFGIDGHEDLWTDLSTAVEHWIDDCCWPEDDPTSQVVAFSEWDTFPVRDHLPSVSYVLEQIDEWSADYGMTDEGFHDQIHSAVDDHAVQVAMEALLDLIASKVTYRMANKIVATHQVRVTWTDTDNKTADWEVVG